MYSENLFLFIFHQFTFRNLCQVIKYFFYNLTCSIIHQRMLYVRSSQEVNMTQDDITSNYYSCRHVIFYFYTINFIVNFYWKKIILQSLRCFLWHICPIWIVVWYNSYFSICNRNFDVIRPLRNNCIFACKIWSSLLYWFRYCNGTQIYAWTFIGRVSIWMSSIHVRKPRAR